MVGDEKGTRAFFPNVKKPSLHLWLKQPPGFLPGLRGPGETQGTYGWRPGGQQVSMWPGVGDILGEV